MTDISQTLDVARETVRPRTRDYLFGPVIDFLCCISRILSRFRHV